MADGSTYYDNIFRQQCLEHGLDLLEVQTESVTSAIKATKEVVDTGLKIHAKCNQILKAGGKSFKVITADEGLAKLIVCKLDLGERGKWILRLHERPTQFDTFHANPGIGGFPKSLNMPKGTIKFAQDHLKDLKKSGVGASSNLIAKGTKYINTTRTLCNGLCEGEFGKAVAKVVAKEAVNKLGVVNMGANVGASLGTMLCPGLGTIVGSFVGAAATSFACNHLIESAVGWFF